MSLSHCRGMRTHRSLAFDLEIANPFYRKIVPRALTGITVWRDTTPAGNRILNPGP